MKKFAKITSLLLLSLALVFVACKKEPEPDPQGEPGSVTDSVGHYNPEPAQNTPMYVNFLPEFNSVYQLSPNADGTFFALADGNETDYLLKLDGTGTVLEKKRLGFRSLRCVAKTNESIVLIGNLGDVSTPYFMHKTGYVAIFDMSMNLLATTTLSDPQFKIELRTILQDSEDPAVFYVGGHAINESFIQFPYIATLRYEEGLMTVVKSRIFDDSKYSRCRILGMVEKKVSGQKDLVLEMTQYSIVNDPTEENSNTVHIAKLNYFEEAWGWGQFTFDVAIEGPHGDSYTGNNSIDSDDESIYFFGFCNDDKELVPANGGYWASGCIAAVNWREGRKLWQRVVSFSERADCFYDGQLLDGYLYVCGRHCGIHYYSTEKRFSNGLVAKFSLSGELISQKTFGDSQRYSKLYHFVKDLNGNMVCAGGSAENLGDDKLKENGWFLKTDL